MKTRILLMMLLPVTAIALAAGDLSGKWTFDGDVQGNAVALNCVVKQSAQAKLSGPCDVNGTEQTELSGEVTDTAVQFSVTVQGYTLNYTGKIDGESVSGNIEVAGASGTFTGKRAK